MEHLIEAIQNRLIEKVPELKEADEDWGQMDFYDERPPVKFPCALIEIQDGSFSDAGDLRQQATLTIVIKLYILRLSNTSNAAPQSQKDSVHGGWLIYDEVVKALHGQDFIKNGFGRPMRRRMAKIKRRDGIYQRDITFSIGYTDLTCVPDRQTVLPKVGLIVEFDK